MQAEMKLNDTIKHTADDMKDQLEAKDQKIFSLQEDLRKAANEEEALLEKIQGRAFELQNEQKETLALKQKQEGLLAELQAQEHTIYQLRSEECNLKSQLKDSKARLEHLQNKLDMSDKLYGRAKQQLLEFENKISDLEFENLELKTSKEEQTVQF
ncbi:GRIP and coiled-coil domain-containing protein 2-like [Pelobates fuscus]|uniref:GRIP and coiled-coil domain-containing protein 2-like n=1 Tax=Pelobates fuscus TaxID=191477 RepID=UPI002FE4994D